MDQLMAEQLTWAAGADARRATCTDAQRAIGWKLDRLIGLGRLMGWRGRIKGSSRGLRQAPRTDVRQVPRGDAHRAVDKTQLTQAKELQWTEQLLELQEQWTV